MNENFQTGSEWRPLYITAGWAAVLMLIFIPTQILVFITNPPPTTVIGWFTLFGHNKLIGLLDMDLLLIVDQVLLALIFLALFTALKRFNKSFATIALAFGIIGSTAYFASSAAFEMLSLSNQYAAATSEAQRNILLSAGQMMYSTWQGTAFDVAYILQGIAFLLIGLVMMRGGVFNKATAYAGIVLGVLSLAPPSAGTIGLILSLLSLVPLVIFLVLIAGKFFNLGKKTLS